MVTKWTQTIPKEAGYYWVSAFGKKGQLIKPIIDYYSDDDLAKMRELIPGMLLYSDKRISEPLLEKY